MTDGITVVVADDHPLYREGVVRTLAAEGDFEVLAEAADAARAVAAVTQYLPDIALIDVSMPGNGLAALREISDQCPVVKAVILTVSEEQRVLQAAIEGGAKGYVLKGVSGGELAQILRRIHGGEPYITSSLAASMLPIASTPSPHPLTPLTVREREILEQLAQGASNREIADCLSIGERTVKHHMTNILQKLQVKNRVAAALMARESIDNLSEPD